MQPTGIKLCKVPRILIVEDDISQRQLMVKLIRTAFDCEILEASDGLEALMIMLQNKQTPDLVLLDLIMPCMNGVEFLKIVRGRPEFNHIPVVICSSVVETKEIREVMSGWIHGYLVKPINKEKLLVKLLAALHDIAVRVDNQY